MPILLPKDKQGFLNETGGRLAAGKVFTYDANSNSPRKTYLNAGMTVENPNPIILDARGEATIYWSGAYKIVLKNAQDVSIWTVDNVAPSDVATSAGAGIVGFLYSPPATINVKDFGAIGDGMIDDTVAMQLAHNTGKLVYYPPGTYKFTTLTAIPSGGIAGAGQTQTVLLSTNTSASDLITFIGNSMGGPGNALTFKDFMLQSQSPTKIAGAGISVNPAINENAYAYFSNVTFSYIPIGVDFVRASFFSLIGCKLLAYSTAGVRVANSFANDSGDSEIIGCTFNCPYSGGSLPAGIKQLSSGGLRVIGNKFLGGNFGYLMAYTDSDGANHATGNLIISGNSIENMFTNGIAFTRISASLLTFKNIIVSGNQFAGAGVGGTMPFTIASDSNAFLQNMVIQGNTFQLANLAAVYGIALNGVTGLLIAGNVFRGNGGVSQAIGLTSCIDAKIGVNVYSNVSTPYNVVSSPGAHNSVSLDSQSGIAVTLPTGWGAYYGSLFLSPTTTVNFPEPFLVAPIASNVEFSLASGDGSIGAIVVAVSKTQLTLAVIASRSPGFVATVNWKVSGIV